MLAQIATTVLGFFLLVAILRKFFWSAILKALDARRDRIAHEFEGLANSKQQLEHLQADYAKRLAMIEEEARTKIQEAVLDGKRIASEMQEQAREQGYALIGKAKETVELELAKAKVTMRDQLVAMTVEAVERVLREKLTAERDRRLVEEMLEEVERKDASA